MSQPDPAASRSCCAIRCAAAAAPPPPPPTVQPPTQTLMRPASKRTPPRSTAVAVAKRPSVAAAKTAAGSGQRAAISPARNDAKMKTLVPLALGAAILLAAGVVMFIGGDAKKTADNGAKAGNDTSVAALETRPTQAAAPPTQTPAQVMAPEADKPQDLSLGARQTPVAPPPPITSPAPPAKPAPSNPAAAAFGPWEDLFNGKSLDGWQPMKGKMGGRRWPVDCRRFH